MNRYNESKTIGQRTQRNKTPSTDAKVQGVVAAANTCSSHVRTPGSGVCLSFRFWKPHARTHTYACLLRKKIMTINF